MNKILIVVDMQNDFITGSLGSEYAKNVVLPNIVKKIEKGDYDKILFTKDSHQKDYLTKGIEGQKLPVEHCIVNTKGYELAKEISEKLTIKAIEENDKFGIMPIVSCNGKPVEYIEKEAFGSFKLPLYMEDEGIYDIEICGLCTDICVISNALILRSYLKNSKITCDSSCCGGTSKEAHDAALLVMKSCQIEVI